jgi:hypothetical protein
MLSAIDYSTNVGRICAMPKLYKRNPHEETNNVEYGGIGGCVEILYSEDWLFLKCCCSIPF